MMPAAKEEASKMELSNVKFEVDDLSLMNESEKYDLITAFDAIHDQAQPTKVLKAIYNALRTKQVPLESQLDDRLKTCDNQGRAIHASLFFLPLRYKCLL